jgi:uncharacterized metal-binding protein
VKKRLELVCARCAEKTCTTGVDCFGLADTHERLYDDPEAARVHAAATRIEGTHYGTASRLAEIIFFGHELGATKIGLAFCVGLEEEARVAEEILCRHFDVLSVCCKACGIDKATFGLAQIEPGRRESICNPAGQADLLNRAGSDLNIVCGLCVGHDAVFSRRSHAPVTTFLVKDRVLAHNPAGAIYCRYVRRSLPGCCGSRNKP